MIKVSEIFGPTVQGEGRSCGMPVAFLRLANCNLHCFLCDTEFTWRFNDRHPHANNIIYQRKDEVHPMSVEEVLEKLLKTGMRHLVISGGEPFLQQKQLVPLIKLLKEEGWYVEVETNGTIKPLPEFVEVVDQINCSPKLESAFSGEGRRVRIREEVLGELASILKVNFKFVICEPGNLPEVLVLIKQFGMKEVRLMPECRTKEEMQEKELWLRAICEDYDFIYCTRLSIEMSGTKRGV